MRFFALAVTALVLAAPLASADHGTDLEPLCVIFYPGGGGLVGVVLTAVADGVCLTTAFTDGASHLARCLVLGGSNC